MNKHILLAVAIWAALSLLGCTPLDGRTLVNPLPTSLLSATPASTATPMPTIASVVTVEVTRQAVIVVATPIYENSLGEAYLVPSSPLEGKPGEVLENVVGLASRGLRQFSFYNPYLCPTRTDPYGIAMVTTSTGGGIPDGVTRYFGIRIFEDSLPGETCSDVIDIYLYDEEEVVYPLAIPIVVVVK